MKGSLFTEKRLLLAAATLCCAACVAATQPIQWKPAVRAGRAKSVKVVENKSIQFDCPISWNDYDYLIADVAVTPFRLDDKSAIQLTVKCQDFISGDSFYFKALNAKGEVVSSFYTYDPLTGGDTLLCIPGRDYGAMRFFANDVKAPAGSTITKLQFFFGRRGPAKPILCQVGDLALVPAPAAPQKKGFKDFGIGISSAELRFCIAVQDARKRPVVVAAPLDVGKTCLLLTELDTGKSFQFYPDPAIQGAAYGGVLTNDGKLVYGVGHQVLIFDLNSRKFTYAGKTVEATLCGAVSPDGTAYLGGYPGAALTQVNPSTGTARDCGRMDDGEHYLQTLAVDREGFVYCGIGSARANIVCWNPKSGKRTQLLPEARRKLGYGKVVQGKDGFVYISFADFKAKCLGGKIVAQDTACPAADNARQLYYGAYVYDIGSAGRIINYSLVNRSIRFCDAAGTIRDIPVSYVSGGLDLTSMCAGPDGKVYFSSAHPHHLGCLDPRSGKITDLGHNPVVGGGNFCNMTIANGKLYSCEYAGGRMWEYDPKDPVRFSNSKYGSFGVPFEKLLIGSAGRNARWSQLHTLGILLGIGSETDNSLTLKLNVPHAGKWYLNGQFYQSGAYGTVTVKAGGKTLSCNTQSAQAAPGKVWSLGPFELSPGYFPAEFSIAVNANSRESQQFFSLMGLELAAAPRETGAQELPVQKLNPRILGRWADLVTRPRTIAVHPDGKTIVMAGYANYGMVGGGFGVHDLFNGTNRAINNFLPGESCIAMGFFPDGTMFGGTCTEAPGGGHTTAASGSVFHYDMKSGKLLHCLKMPCRTIRAVTFWKGMVYAAGVDGFLYRIDPKTWQIVGKKKLNGGSAPLNGLLVTPDGRRLFLLQRTLISEILPDGNVKDLALPPHVISAGGAVVDGRIYYLHSTARLGCWIYLELQK